MRSIDDDVIVETFQTASFVKKLKLSRLTVGWVIGDNLIQSCAMFTKQHSDNNDKN